MSNKRLHTDRMRSRVVSQEVAHHREADQALHQEQGMIARWRGSMREVEERVEVFVSMNDTIGAISAPEISRIGAPAGQWAGDISQVGFSSPIWRHLDSGL